MAPEDGAVYVVECQAAGRTGVVFAPSGSGPAAPKIDPELVPRRAVDSMRLAGPAVRPRAQPGGTWSGCRCG
ncbi:hypothetical protein [Streptomyces sp. NPDC056242]|uniref:hypothetical protein n=1 Tax=Streptomyces sp. NPDC056242 TaxID=3345760 RepID=UPI0035DECF62